MKSKRLKYRELSKKDISRLFEIYSNAEAMKYRESPVMITIDDANEMLIRDEEVKKKNYEFRFGIELLTNSELIGTVMYQPLSDKAIIGYSIDEKYWNNGFATEVVAFIVNYLKEKKFRQIDAWVKKENKASIKVLEKNNFSVISQTLFPNSVYCVLYL